MSGILTYVVGLLSNEIACCQYPLLCLTWSPIRQRSPRYALSIFALQRFLTFMPIGQFYSMQQMRLSDVLFYLFSFLLPILVSLSILAFLDSHSYIPITRLTQGIRFISPLSRCLAVSFMFMFIPPTKPPIPSIHHSPPLAIYHTTFHPNPHTLHNIRTSPTS